MVLGGLDHVTGWWVDQDGSNYEVTLDAKGHSCSVKTRRPDGKTIQTSALLYLDETTGAVSWGKKFYLAAKENNRSEIIWRAWSGNSRSFTWTRAKRCTGPIGSNHYNAVKPRPADTKLKVGKGSDNVSLNGSTETIENWAYMDEIDTVLPHECVKSRSGAGDTLVALDSAANSACKATLCETCKWRVPDPISAGAVSNDASPELCHPCQVAADIREIVQSRRLDSCHDSTMVAALEGALAVLKTLTSDK